MRVLLATVAAAVFAVVPAAIADTPASGPVTIDRSGAGQLLALVNAERARHGVPPLSRDARLEEVAVAHSLEMARTGVLKHNDALFTRTMHTSLGIKTFAENVAFDSTVPAAHDLLMNSPPHRTNLLGAAYRLAGLAVVRDGKGTLWVTEDFGTPRTAPAAVTAAAPRPAPKPAARVTSRPKPAARPAAVVTPKPAATPRATAARRPATRRTPDGRSVRNDAPPVRTVAAAQPAQDGPWPQLLLALALLPLARRPRRQRVTRPE